MLFKRKSEEERSERHFTLTRRIYYIYILVTVYDLFMYLAGLVSVLSRPAAQTEIMDTGTHLWFYIMDGNFVRFPKEYLPFEVDAPSVDGKLFAAAFLLLTFIANKLPIFFIVWKGYRILRAMKRSYTPFVPEIAGHICWIGRTALFIGLFGNLTIQGGMSLVFQHKFGFMNPTEVSWTLAGLILLLVSDIFKRGCTLQKEVDETL